MDPLPYPTPSTFSGREVLQQVAAWGILAAVSGIAFIAYTVPRSLDTIQTGQHLEAQRSTAIEGRVTGVEQRVTRLEAQR